MRMTFIPEKAQPLTLHINTKTKFLSQVHHTTLSSFQVSIHPRTLPSCSSIELLKCILYYYKIQI